MAKIKDRRLGYKDPACRACAMSTGAKPEREGVPGGDQNWRKEMSDSGNSRMVRASDVDAIVIGAGFAGLYTVYKLRQMGLSHRAFEQGGGVGGTW